MQKEYIEARSIIHTFHTRLSALYLWTDADVLHVNVSVKQKHLYAQLFALSHAELNRSIEYFNLGKDESLWAPAIQTEHKSDGLKKFLDAGSELFFLHSTGCSGVKDPRLNNKLEKIFQGLKE